MDALKGRLRREQLTFVCMARIYCSHHHAPPAGGLCEECAALMAYAEKRLQRCPYGDRKPTCAKCPVHCYKPEPRQRAREIMRFAGPRMPLRHPIRSLTHLFDKLRKVEHPMELRRKKRGAAGPPNAWTRPLKVGGYRPPGIHATETNQARPAPSKPKAGS